MATSWNTHLATDQTPALGFVECSSISRGLFLTDVILKKAAVRMIASQPVSSGKHVVLFFGDVASVTESFNAAKDAGDGCILKDTLIPSVHENLVPFLDSLWESPGLRAPAGESVAVIESQSLAAAILAADAALKAARVFLCRMRLGQGIGGKAFFVISGRQEEVEAGVETARGVLSGLESLYRTDLIQRPTEDAMAFL